MSQSSVPIHTIGQTSRHGDYSGSDQTSIYHLPLVSSLLCSPFGWSLPAEKITWIKYSTSQVGSMAEGCSQASLALRRTSGCTPKKGSCVMYA